MHYRPHPRIPTLAIAAALALTGVACEGGDVSPEDAAGGGVPPREVQPQPNVGQSEGFPDEFSDEVDIGEEPLEQ
jgi:hypothetical protein